MSAEPISRETPLDSNFQAKPQARNRLLRWLGYVPISLALLLPCYWQSRIQASNLSSHIYNAWLTELIQSGRTEGLALVRPTTNILLDLLQYSLLRSISPDWA